MSLNAANVLNLTTVIYYDTECLMCVKKQMDNELNYQSASGPNTSAATQCLKNIHKVYIMFIQCRDSRQRASLIHNSTTAVIH